MSVKTKQDAFLVGFFFAAGLLILLGLTWLSASMEAAAYRRVTGRQVSTWDAIWLELRVDGSPEEDAQ